MLKRFSILGRWEECSKKRSCTKSGASSPAGLLSLSTAVMVMEKLLIHSVQSSRNNFKVHLNQKVCA